MLDSARMIRYHGRVDDQYGLQPNDTGKAVAYQLAAPRRQDLSVALDELLAGKTVSIAETDASGCLIGRQQKAVADSDVTYSNQIARRSEQALRVLPSRWPDRSIRADELRRCGRLGRDDQRGGARTADASLARRSTPRRVFQRLSSERRRQASDRRLGRGRRAARQSRRSARIAKIRGRLDDSRAGPGDLHGQAIHRPGRRNGALPELCRRSRLDRRQVGLGDGAPPRHSGRGASYRDVRRASARRVEVLQRRPAEDGSSTGSPRSRRVCVRRYCPRERHGSFRRAPNCCFSCTTRPTARSKTTAATWASNLPILRP